MTERANESDKLSEDEKWDKVFRPQWEKFILPFLEGPETSPPDVKAFAKFLRYANPPLPDSFLLMLAEFIEPDDETPSLFACNWRLELKFTGKHDHELMRIEREEKIQAKLDDVARGRGRRRRMTVTKAIETIAEEFGVSKRTVETMRQEKKRRLKWWDEFMKQWTPFGPEDRAQILRAMEENRINPFKPGELRVRRRRGPPEAGG
jgi:hypothetical protein